MASMFTPQALMGAITSPEFGWRTTHFWGPIANWGLVVAGVYDATKKGPEVISLNMTSTLCVYSALFMRFAWKVQPRNYLLLSCHAFNEAVQLWQFKRGYEYQQTLGKELSFKESADESIARQPAPAGFNFPLFGAAIGTGVAATAAGQTIKERLMAATFLPESARTIMNHPAGPFTIHFWAPTMKWMLSVSNLLDYDRPVENVSTLQQTALCATGFIWSRYAMVINPVNYNLFAVNVSLAITGTYHLGRKVKASMATEKEEKEL